MALVLALGGCGDGADDIPRREAAELVVLVENIREQVASESCEAAIASSRDLEREVQRLDRDNVPDDVINALSGGVQSLESLVIQDCDTGEDTTTTTTTEPETTETEPTTTTTEETTETTEPTTDTTTTTEDETTTDTNGTGGSSDGGTGAPTGGAGGGGGGGNED